MGIKFRRKNPLIVKSLQRSFALSGNDLRDLLNSPQPNIVKTIYSSVIIQHHLNEQANKFFLTSFMLQRQLKTLLEKLKLKLRNKTHFAPGDTELTDKKALDEKIDQLQQEVDEYREELQRLAQAQDETNQTFIQACDNYSSSLINDEDSDMTPELARRQTLEITNIFQKKALLEAECPLEEREEKLKAQEQEMQDLRTQIEAPEAPAPLIEEQQENLARLEREYEKSSRALHSIRSASHLSVIASMATSDGSNLKPSEIRRREQRLSEPLRNLENQVNTHHEQTTSNQQQTRTIEERLTQREREITATPGEEDHIDRTPTPPSPLKRRPS